MDKRKKTRIRRKNMGIKILVLILIIIFILIKFVIPASVTFSRYVYSKVRNYYLYSKEFYFNSDKLSLEGSYFEADNWSGSEGDTYRVDINMNSKNNSLEVSKVDIPYTITYTCGVYHSDDTAYSESLDELIDFEIEKTSGTIYTNYQNTDPFYFKITSNYNKFDDDDYVLVTVSASATSPYKETISGTFKISIGNLGMKYQIEDEADSPYLEVTVTNTLNYYIVQTAFSGYVVGDQITTSKYLELNDEQKANCKSMTIELTFDPNQVTIDTTSAMYLQAEDNNNYTVRGIQNGDNTYTYVDSITFDIEAEESKVIRFYKAVASNDYTYPGTEKPIVTVTQKE